MFFFIPLCTVHSKMVNKIETIYPYFENKIRSLLAYVGMFTILQVNCKNNSFLLDSWIYLDIIGTHTQLIF